MGAGVIWRLKGSSRTPHFTSRGSGLWGAPGEPMNIPVVCFLVSPPCPSPGGWGELPGVFMGVWADLQGDGPGAGPGRVCGEPERGRT